MKQPDMEFDPWEGHESDNPYCGCLVCLWQEFQRPESEQVIIHVRSDEEYAEWQRTKALEATNEA